MGDGLLSAGVGSLESGGQMSSAVQGFGFALVRAAAGLSDATDVFKKVERCSCI